jgi:hypothetical protein
MFHLPRAQSRDYNLQTNDEPMNLIVRGNNWPGTAREIGTGNLSLLRWNGSRHKPLKTLRDLRHGSDDKTGLFLDRGVRVVDSLQPP